MRDQGNEAFPRHFQNFRRYDEAISILRFFFSLNFHRHNKKAPNSLMKYLRNFYMLRREQGSFGMTLSKLSSLCRKNLQFGGILPIFFTSPEKIP